MWLCVCVFVCPPVTQKSTPPPRASFFTIAPPLPHTHTHRPQWGYGYTKKFGLHHVDFATLERVPKMSAAWYGEVIRKNRLDMV